MFVPGQHPIGRRARCGDEPTRHEAAGRGAATRCLYLLSGGGDPFTNNYSQYVQARAIAGFFERECPPDSTWIFSGIGNREGAPPLLADTRREFERDGRVLQSWVPGVLKNNRPATRDVVLRALREEILPAVQGGGTLYLFVGDHGELAGKGENRESAIILWQLKRGRRRSTGWFTDAREVLGVSELRRVLAEGLGQGRVVFCMTQCHAGGFHELGVAHDMQPLREWFAVPPSERADAAWVRLCVAGFTATDQNSPAVMTDIIPVCISHTPWPNHSWSVRRTRRRMDGRISTPSFPTRTSTSSTMWMETLRRLAEPSPCAIRG